MKRAIHSLSLMLALTPLLLGCASTSTQLPDISAPALRAESILQENQALATQTAYIERLSLIGRRVLLANAELCPKTRRDIGVLIHSEESYPKEMRIAARRELGATATPTIFHIVPASPAEKAGFKIGDTILIDEHPVKATDKQLQAALKPDSVSVTVLRDGETQTLNVEPDTLCHSRLRLRPSAVINAIADGRHITVTTGMMEFTQSDDELAMIVGHELAHNTMGHIRKVVGNFILSGFATRYTRPFESEADYVGLYYMVRAGFNPDGVEDFWRRLADINPRSVNRAKTHPTFPDRFLRITAAREEIRAKQASGEALVPNFKSDDDDA